MKSTIKFLTISVIVFAFTSNAFSQVPNYVPTNGLVGYWPFNGNANDESGNGNNGTVMNGVLLTSDRFNNLNFAYSFDGVDDYISCNPILGINEVSISIWFKKDGLGGHLVSQNNWINAQSVSFASAYEKISNVFSVGCNNGNCSNPGSQSGTSVPYNLNSDWHHRITTISVNGELNDYLDGQLINSSTITNFQWCTSVSSILKFGAWWNSDIQSWEGKLDDIGIWNRALTPQEITNLYTSTVPVSCLPAYVPTSGLVGYWPFCGNANDESGNGNNGTVNGATLTTDRFGNANSAYYFDYYQDIVTPFNLISGTQSRTISFWMKNSNGQKTITPIWYGGNSSQPQMGAAFNLLFNRNETLDQCGCWPEIQQGIGVSADWIYFLRQYNTGDNQWHFYSFVLANSGDSFSQVQIFVDGVLLASNEIFNYNGNASTTVNTVNNNPLVFGRSMANLGYPSDTQMRAPTEYLDDISIYNRALTPTEITQLYSDASVTPPVACTPFLGEDQTVCAGTSVTLSASGSSLACPTLPSNLQNGLVGYWPFCGNANDASGNGNNGTVNGATLTTDRFGSANSAFSLSGTSNSILVNDSPSLDFPQGVFSLCAEVKLSGLGVEQGLIDHLDVGGPSVLSRYTLRVLPNNKIRFNLKDDENDWSSVDSDISLDVNVWYSIVGVFNYATQELHIYINGEIHDGTIIYNALTGPAITPPNSLFLGNFAGAYNLNGTIDNVSIYNRALSPSEIQQLYTIGQSTYLWSTGATTANISVTPTQTTTYTCTVTDANGNVCTDSVTVFVPQIEATDLSICAGESTSLSISGINSTSTTSACPTLPTNLQTGLVGYWPFCGNANDASGNGNNGTVNGATLTADRFGNTNSAYSFDGLSGINCSMNAVPSGNQNRSLNLWIKTDNINQVNKMLAGYGNDSPLQMFSLIMYNPNALGKVAFWARDNDTPFLNSVEINEWTMFSVTYDGSAIFLYENGVLILSNDYSFIPLVTPLSSIFHIGDFNSNVGGFNGTIDDVSIYNRALSPSEIQQLYTLGQTTYLWSNGATTASISVTPTQTTTYTCTVTDANGNACIDSVTVVVNNPTIDLGNDVTACGTSTTLTAPTGFDSYLWSNGATTNTTTVSANGTYSCTVTQGGCSASDTLEVVLITLDAGQDLTVLNGTQVTLTATGAETYSWTNGIQNGVPFPATSSQSYIVTGTNSIGCSNSDTVLVTVVAPPSISITASDSTLCLGDSLTLTAQLTQSSQLSLSFPYTKLNGAELWVSPSGSDVTGSGTFANPFQTIQHSIDLASNGQIVTLKNGIYSGSGNVNSTTLGKQITVQSENGPLSTIIDCNQAGRAFIANSGESMNTIIKGIKILNGKTNNSPIGYGSAIFVDDNSGLKIIDCIFQSNVEGCIQFGDTEVSGPQSAIENCAFIQNQQNCISASKKSFYTESCFFYGNTSSGELFGNGHVADPSQYYQNCIFKCNNGIVIGGLGHGKQLNNSLFIGNTSTQGTIYMGTNWSGTNRINHCTFYNNTCSYYNSGWYDHTGQVLSSIFYPGDARNHVSGNQGQIPFSNCLGNNISGNGNIQGDPLFVSPSSNNFNLLSGSPCTGTGVSGSNMGADPSIIQPWLFNFLDFYSQSYSTVTWENGAQTSSITIAPTSSGYISVSYSGSGSILTDSIYVQVTNLTSVNAGQDQTICPGTSITLTAPTGYDSYLWSNGGTTNTTTVSANGTYSCTVTQGGCSASDSIDVTLIDATITASANTVCSGTAVYLVISSSLTSNTEGTSYVEIPEGSSGVLQAPVGAVFTSINFASYGVPSGGGGNYQYQWCHASNSIAIVSNLCLGNNSCVLSSNNDVFGDPCGGTPKRLFVLATYSNNNISYLWSTGETTATINVSPTTTTTYTCTVTTNGVSCTDSVTVVVNNPTINLGSDVTACGTSTTLTAPAGFDSYLWSNGATTNTTTVSANGTYSCIVTQGGCSASDSIDVTLIDATISASANTVCSGTAVTITASANGLIESSQDTLLVETTSMNMFYPFSYTSTALQSNVNYLLKVYGTVGFAGNIDSQDAAFQYNWFGSPVSPYPFPNASSVWWFVNGSNLIRPTPDIYNPSHIYYFNYTGNGQPLNISWTDSPYSDNSGQLNFALYRLSDNVTTTYLWSNGATTPSITVSPTSTTTYTCTTTTNGVSCSSNYTITVNNSTASTIIVTAFDSFTWLDGNTYTASNNTATYTTTNAAGCDSVISLNLTITPLSASLSLQVFLDGYYTNNSNPAAMTAARYNNLVASGSTTPGAATDVDVITVELRSPYNLDVVAYSVSPILQTNGSVQCVFPAGALGGSFYIVVKHRATNPLWSANPITLTTSTTYNFAYNLENAYSDGDLSLAPMHTIVSSLYGIWLGELNEDGYLDATDYSNLELDIYASGYLGLYLLDGDLNGDTYVDASDFAVFESNSIYGPYEQRPYAITTNVSIGQSYQGGIVAYILQPGDIGYDATMQHGLIAAPSDQGIAQWGCTWTTAVSGAYGQAIGTGAQNTLDIMNGCSEAGIAARLCGDLVLGGYSDWYLPSLDELNKLSLNKVAIGGFAAGDFPISIYWSSTAFNNGNNDAAWGQNFYYGYQHGHAKVHYASVRAVRSF